MRGKKSINDEGIYQYNLEDAFTTFDGVTNTPKYWQKVKYDMIAKLENIGPFHLFFTLSCGDSRYDENFSTFLTDNGYILEYISCKDGSRETIVRGNKNGKEINKELNLFLQEDVNDSLHEMIRTNVLTATRNFNHRIESFKKEILYGHNNPMKIKHISYRVEFQGRGAAHIHGTLWLDIKKIEELIISKDNSKTVKPGDLSNAFMNLRHDTKLKDAEKVAIQRFTDTFISCSLNPKTVHKDLEKGQQIVQTIKEVNLHHCTRKCKSYEGKCRYAFPRFPLKETLVIDKNEMKTMTDQEPKNDKHRKILNDVESIIRDPEMVEFIMDQFTKGDTEEEYHENMSKRIDLLLQIAGEIKYEDYLTAIKGTRKFGSSVMLRRDVDEIWINNYNPEWALSWNANHDIQPVLDYFATITYVTDYWAKSDDQVTQHLKEAAESLKFEKNLKRKCQEMANTFLTHRQMSECEAYYKIFPNLHLKFSSLDTVFIPTDKKELRSRFLKKLDNDDGDLKHGTTVMGGREGLFLEKPDIVDKYCRRIINENNPQLAEMSLIQFAKMYQPIRRKNVTEEYEEREEEDNDFKDSAENKPIWTDEEDRITNYFITINPNYNQELLPNTIRLGNCQPGEISLWEKRLFPKAARFHKKKENNDPHRYFLSELMLYKGFTNEQQIGSQDESLCRDLYLKHKNDIQKVKNILLPFATGVEEARHYVEEALQSMEAQPSNVGDILDPEQEQEIAECQEIDNIHPDFVQLNPNDLDIENPSKQMIRSFRRIEIKTNEKILEDNRKLDTYQKEALHMAIKYAQNVALAKKGKCTNPEAPLIFIHGGAGSGKSTLINQIYQNVHTILQTEGDDPDCPYVLITAYTGTAAANINGQTLHTLFSFNFGSGYMSLSDKMRDEKRNLFKNLKMLIIDEISLVDADMLYKIDLRLREVTGIGSPFGNIAVIVLGDLMQMSPVTGRFIFLDPRDEQFHLSHNLDPLWRKFHCITLKENHRQGDDKAYAEMLNRIRVGKQTDEDIQKLKERVRNEAHDDIKKEKDALFIFGTNKNVNKMNNKRLKELNGEEHMISAICLHRTIKDFSPQEGKAGEVNKTPFQKELRLKIGAKVMLTYNVDTTDGLTNGARGELLDVLTDSKKNITKLIIRFENPNVGQEKRRCNPQIAAKYPLGTPIEKINFSFSISRSKKSIVNTASVIQFPVRLAFACTAHKVQGLTIAKPQRVIINVKDTFAAAMVYVMLSRVCSMSQIYILNEFNETKMYPNINAIAELFRLETLENDQNNKNESGLKIYSLNCRSLRKHFDDILTDSRVLRSNIICLQETWIEDDTPHRYEIPSYTYHPNSFGRGKGIVIFYKQDNFEHIADIKKENLQLTKLSSITVDVIVVYRSQTCPYDNLNEAIKKLLTVGKPSLVVGDFNFCFKDQTTSTKRFLIKSQFVQLIKEPTHSDGHILDQAYLLYNERRQEIITEVDSKYYSDHRGLSVIIRNKVSDNHILI